MTQPIAVLPPEIECSLERCLLGRGFDVVGDHLAIDLSPRKVLWPVAVNGCPKGATTVKELANIGKDLLKHGNLLVSAWLQPDKRAAESVSPKRGGAS